jgi:hypothetical protein
MLRDDHEVPDAWVDDLLTSGAHVCLPGLIGLDRLHELVAEDAAHP